MIRQWIIGLAALALVIATPGLGKAGNTADDTCPNVGATCTAEGVGTPCFVVDTAAEAITVANNYDRPECNLVVKTTLTPITDRRLVIEAKSFKSVGPLDIINGNSESKITIIADNGNIDINKTNLIAADTVRMLCLAPADCKITVKDSDLEANRHIIADAQGDGRVTGTNVIGGEIDFRSKNGSFTWFCGGANGCQDPFVSGTAKALCGDPPVFPCNVTFNTEDELREVCILAPGVTCSGSKIFVGAKTFVDITGSAIDSAGHFLIIAGEGPIEAANTTLTSATKIIMSAFTTVNIANAKIEAPGDVRIAGGEGSGNCPVPDGTDATDCIDAEGSAIKSNDITMIADADKSPKRQIDLCEATLDQKAAGPPFPKVNGDDVPEYSPNVLDTTAECAPRGGAVVDGVAL